RKNSPTAVSLGHSPSHTRLKRPLAGAMGTSRASRPAISASWSVRGACCISSAMTADLLAEPVGDQAGQGGHLRVVEAPGTGDVDPELVDDAARPAGEDQHPITEADGLPHVVGHEHDGEAGFG